MRANKKIKENKKLRRELKKREVPKINFKAIQKEQTELLAKEKQPSELLYPLKGIVQKVQGIQIPVSEIYYPRREDPINYSPLNRRIVYHKGLEIKIKSETPVTTLQFLGDSPIRKGDGIKAYVVKGKKEALPPLGIQIQSQSYPGYSQTKTKTYVLVEGNFQKEMIALQIDILYANRTNYGRNYNPKTKRISKPYLPKHIEKT